MIYGYARVSTSEQETRLQVDALRAAGVQQIFEEKRSAVRSRPQLRILLAVLKPGDTLVVWKIDRLARSLKHLLAVLDTIVAAGADFRSLTEPIDTGTPMGEFVCQILGAVAQLERSIIRERCMAGQRAAMARGVHCGRPRTLSPRDEVLLVRMYRSGWYTFDALALAFDVHSSVVKRAVYRVAKPGHSSLR